MRSSETWHCTAIDIAWGDKFTIGFMMQAGEGISCRHTSISLARNVKSLPACGLSPMGTSEKGIFFGKHVLITGKKECILFVTYPDGRPAGRLLSSLLSPEHIEEHKDLLDKDTLSLLRSTEATFSKWSLGCPLLATGLSSTTLKFFELHTIGILLGFMLGA